MRKLPAVEEARAIMREAQEWSMWRWLTEKRRVREAADRATAALNEAEAKVKSGWSAELTEAYDDLLAEESGRTRRRRQRSAESEANADLLAIARRVKEADDEAEKVRLEAEDIFAEAERRLSSSMARNGAKRALDTYDLHETAIRKAEAALRSGRPAA